MVKHNYNKIRYSRGTYTTVHNYAFASRFENISSNELNNHFGRDERTIFAWPFNIISIQCFSLSEISEKQISNFKFVYVAGNSGNPDPKWI